jgi:sugar phosphate isomerase/epimerase
MVPLSRRGFLRSTAAASALAAVPALSEAGDPKPPDPFGGFNVGLQTYTLRNFKQLDQVLERIRDLGLHYAEFYRDHVPVTSTDDQIKAIRRLCREYEVTPIAFGVERFTKDHDANRRIFEFARNLGVRYLSADPDPESFGSLDKLVGEFNISIAIHPHGPINAKELHRYFTAERIMAAVREHDRRIGSCLDTGHLIRSAQEPFNEKLDPPAQIRAMGNRNFGIHLKDHDNQNRRDVPFGKGPLDVLAVLRALREVKFQGYISIEYEANPDNPMPDLRACVQVLRESVRKLT